MIWGLIYSKKYQTEGAELNKIDTVLKPELISEPKITFKSFFEGKNDGEKVMTDKKETQIDEKNDKGNLRKTKLPYRYPYIRGSFCR